MRFTVTWKQSARDGLASIWLAARNRQAIRNAADRIDQALSRDADLKGMPFCGERLFVAGPLAVTYTCSREECLVQVLQVWHR